MAQPGTQQRLQNALGKRNLECIFGNKQFGFPERPINQWKRLIPPAVQPVDLPDRPVKFLKRNRVAEHWRQKLLSAIPELVHLGAADVEFIQKTLDDFLTLGQVTVQKIVNMCAHQRARITIAPWKEIKTWEKL